MSATLRVVNAYDHGKISVRREAVLYFGEVVKAHKVPDGFEGARCFVTLIGNATLWVTNTLHQLNAQWEGREVEAEEIPLDPEESGIINLN